ATVGAQVAAGRDFGALVAAQSDPVDPRQTRLLQEADTAVAARVFAMIAAAEALDQTVRAAIGALALSAKTAAESLRREAVQMRLGFSDWPQTRLLITSVEAESGEFVVWE